jgi:hypothetical protein
MISTKLLQLFQSIERFHARATQNYNRIKLGQGFSMPDDPEEEDTPISNEREKADKYQQIVDAARQVSDPSLSSELLLIADMYKKAIELGGGYNSINRAISNTINMYLEDEDNPEESSVEDLLNDVVKDLRTRAGGAVALNKPDSPEIIAQLKKFKDEFNERSVQEEIDDLSQFDEKAVSTFDPTGGMGKEESQKGAGRGYYVKTVKSLKDWVEHYRNEQQRYLEDFAQNTDKNVKPKITKVLEVLSQLINKVSQANALQQEITNEPDPAKEAQLEKLQNEIKELKTKRGQIKSSLRRDLLEVQHSNLESDLKNAKTPADRFLSEQKLELNKTLSSRDKNRGGEIKLRRLLINSMSEGRSLGADTLKKLMDKIQDAKNLRIPIEEVRKEEAEVIKNKKQTIVDPAMIDPETGRNIKQNVYNWGAMKLDGFVVHLSQKILAERKSLKDKILGVKNKSTTEAEKAFFKPYMDAVAAAANDKDKSALTKAVRDLREQVKKAIRLTPEFTRYIISVRSSKFFYAYRDRLKFLQKMQSENQSYISEEEVAYIQATIDMGEKLVSYYENLVIKTLKGKEYPTGYSAPTATINMINGYLSNLLLKSNVGKQEKINPETGEVGYE